MPVWIIRNCLNYMFDTPHPYRWATCMYCLVRLFWISIDCSIPPHCSFDNKRSPCSMSANSGNRSRLFAPELCYAQHYNDAIMSAMVSQITRLDIVYSTVYSGVDQRKYQSSASLVFVRGIHRWPVDSPHKRPVTRKMFPFDDVIMRPEQEPFPCRTAV